jgi:hypothetical protein
MGISPELAAAGNLSPEEVARRRYPAARERIRQLVADVVPRGSVVAVVSKGDAELLRLDGRTGWHFPRNRNGDYAGFHPADGTAAVEQLEQVRSEGADYFLVPSTYGWWLEHYRELTDHLDAHCLLLADDPECARIYLLRPDSRCDPPSEAPASLPVGGPGVADPPTSRLMGLVEPIRALVEALIPTDAVVLVASGGRDELLDVGRRSLHFPQDDQDRWAGLEDAEGRFAIGQLESLRARGASYLVVPWTAWPWLSEHGDLVRYLQLRHRAVAVREPTCAIFELLDPGRSSG